MNDFARDGYEVIPSFLGEGDCALLRSHIEADRAGAEWEKGRAAVDPVLHALGSRSALLERVRLHLGKDVVLYGASVVRRVPGQLHPWHTDIDSWDPSGGFASVWIGLSNTSRATALNVVPGSHRFGCSIQEKAHSAGVPRDERSARTALELARQIRPDAELLEPDLRNGDALLFDGRLWHGSLNSTQADTRVAILLQYADASKRIRIPDFTQLDWPFRLLEQPLPPLIVVAGSAPSNGNRLVPPPRPPATEPVMSQHTIRPIDLPLARDEERGWKPHPLFTKATPIVSATASHVSVLEPGFSPHPPHSHAEEELLIVLDGEARLIVGPSDKEEEGVEHIAGRGTVAYYPAFQFHTIRNRSDRPVTYLMLKWTDGVLEEPTRTGAVITQTAPALARASSLPFDTKIEFERPTDWLGMLHCHSSVLQPGHGYEPHVDAYDVAIIVMEGAVEVDGRRVGPFGIIHHPAGTAHGIRNPEDAPARYLVFEFHHRDRPFAELAAAKPRRSRFRRFLARIAGR